MVVIKFNLRMQRLFAIFCDCKEDGPNTFFSQFTQLKFSNLDVWSKDSRMIFLAGVYFRGIKFSQIDGNFAKIRCGENFTPHGVPLCGRVVVGTRPCI